MSTNYQQYEDAANTNTHIYDHKHATHGIGATEGEVLPPHQSNFDPAPEEGHWTKGEHQPKRCNDVIFGILFYVHLVIMMVVTGIYAPQVVDLVGDINNMNDRYLYVENDVIEEVNSTKSIGIKFANLAAQTANHFLYRTNNDNERELEENDDVSGTNDIGDMLLLLGISAIIALVISTAALSVMISHAEKLIKFALIFNIVTTAVVSIELYDVWYVPL